jgi:L-glyceraldehyde 3-phosphate reductase
MPYTPDPSRYEQPALYRRCGRSGLKLPAISLGLWHNFGAVDNFTNSRALVLRAFDLGITHFDLANNYGPPPGSAEETFGKILHADLAAHRDELIISTKAGYLMWDGPYGEWGSRKYLLASLDQSLRRLKLDYVDIFYSHRPDPHTPLEETMGAVAHAVRSGKALYAGLSNYSADLTTRAAKILRDLGTPCLIHQPKYHLFDRWIEHGLTRVLADEGIGGIAFCPLAQGLLTNRYLGGIPADSRAGHDPRFLKPEHITEDKLGKIRQLDALARQRGQSLAQMSLAWVLRNPAITSALIGASKTSQIEENLAAVKNLAFSPDELATIDRIIGGGYRDAV